MNTNLSRQLAVVSAILLLAVSLLTAQSYRARISGLVTDQTQAVVAGATVTLLNVHTGVKTVRQTNETGLYLFDLVDPGTYKPTLDVTELAGQLTQMTREEAESCLNKHRTQAVGRALPET